MPTNTNLHLSPEVSGGNSTAPLGGGAAPGTAGGVEPIVKQKITFGSGGNVAPVESNWKRAFNKNGTGATHVRTFTAKLTPSSLEYLDRHINEWLDAHTDCEAKFSTVTVGEIATSMGKEATLVVQVWI